MNCFPILCFQTIDVGKIIAIYSCETVNEPFYSSDDNDHHIPAGTGYMVVNYLEKASKNF